MSSASACLMTSRRSAGLSYQASRLRLHYPCCPCGSRFRQRCEDRFSGGISTFRSHPTGAGRCRCRRTGGQRRSVEIFGTCWRHLSGSLRFSRSPKGHSSTPDGNRLRRRSRLPRCQCSRGGLPARWGSRPWENAATEDVHLEHGHEVAETRRQHRGGVLILVFRRQAIDGAGFAVEDDAAVPSRAKLVVGAAAVFFP